MDCTRNLTPDEVQQVRVASMKQPRLPRRVPQRMTPERAAVLDGYARLSARFIALTRVRAADIVTALRLQLALVEADRAIEEYRITHHIYHG